MGGSRGKGSIPTPPMPRCATPVAGRGGHGFETRPASARRCARILVTIRGRPFLFLADSSVFSREGLDRGTELLLEAIQVGPCESIIDLGCGYRVIGIVAAH